MTNRFQKIRVTLRSATATLNENSNRAKVLSLLIQEDLRKNRDYSAFIKKASDQRRKEKLSATQVRMALNYLAKRNFVSVS